jgi:hypothetical protein
VPSGFEGGELALVLGALVDRQVRAAVLRGLVAYRPACLPECGGRRSQDDTANPGPRRGSHDRLRATDVHVEQRDRIGGTEGVDARDVEYQLATAHTGSERVLVEHVAACDLGTAFVQCHCRGVRAGERHDLVPAAAQRIDERATDEPASPG